MSYVTDEQISELSQDSFRDKCAFVSRGASKIAYTLVAREKSGMKSVVWRAKDDLGNDVALKIIPSADYTDRSLIDEMSDATKLDPKYFAEVKFFGDLEIQNECLSTSYFAIITKWIDGEALDLFLSAYKLTIPDFLSVADNLFRSIANLRKHNLCHDDLHPGNILLEKIKDELSEEIILTLKVIDTGTVKSLETRDRLLKELRTKITTLSTAKAATNELRQLQELFEWKQPDDHLRATECLLHAANALTKNYARLDSWERKVVDELPRLFQRLVDEDSQRRLDEPSQVLSELNALVEATKTEDRGISGGLSSPFDYISAEMIRNDRQFSELFSRECPWLRKCESLEPLYLYGPRGSGKSSVLRWLSFKTVISDPSRSSLHELHEIGVYVSCSVELRSRFWLLNETTIDRLQAPILRFFNLLLLEELFDTFLIMWVTENSGVYNFGLKSSKATPFVQWVIERLSVKLAEGQLRLQGQNCFEYLKGLVRKMRWETWSIIQKGDGDGYLPDPSLAIDICRVLPEYFTYFKDRHITFLIDDYSNQRIPVALQRKLNQTISFAKQGTPLFKVSSEYQGVDLEGVQEGREVVEINIGDKYSSLDNKTGAQFLADIVNIRLRRAKYASTIHNLLGKTSYPNMTMAKAIADETQTLPFYYHGLDCVHGLCSGDMALALDLIKRIFDAFNVRPNTIQSVPPHVQHKIIQQFSHDEVRRIKYIVPDGDRMHEIICYLGAVARAFVKNKRSGRKDKSAEPMCKTHLDVRLPAIRELKNSQTSLWNLYDLLTSRAILMSLETSRSRISQATERLQLKRIYLPSFKAPLKRDDPIKIDSADDLKSLLSSPRTFAERELKKSDIKPDQLSLAFRDALVKPVGT